MRSPRPDPRLVPKLETKYLAIEVRGLAVSLGAAFGSVLRYVGASVAEKDPRCGPLRLLDILKRIAMFSRVLYVTSAQLGRPYAPASRAQGLASALSRRGLTVDLVGIGPPPEEPLPGVTVRCLPRPPARKWGAVVWHASLGARLARLRARAYDVLLLRETPYCIEPAVFARCASVPMVLEVNGVTEGPGGRAPALARACYGLNYRAADRIAALTEDLAAYLRRSFRVPGRRITVIGNAADTSKFSPRDPQESRRAMGLPEDAFVVLYMGSFHPQQGVECLLPLCERLRGRIPRLLFALTGEGAERDALARRAEGSGLAGWFRFLGRVPDARIAACVSAADAAFSPIHPDQAWRTEATFPQKIVEYLACGVPVLAMGTSAAQRALLEGGACGRLVEPFNGFLDRLADTLVSWHADPAGRRALGSRGAELIRSRHTYDAVAAEFEQLFRSL